MSLRWRLILVGGMVAFLCWVAVANTVDLAERKGIWWLPNAGMRLGLDLRGGVHVVLGPDFAVAEDQELAHVESGLQSDLDDKKVPHVKAMRKKGELFLGPGPAAQMKAVRDVLDNYKTVAVREDGDQLVVTLVKAQVKAVHQRAMEQALEVLRRRVGDPQTGIPESVITRQGQDRILVEIPGMDRVPDIVRTTGFLEFKIVQDVADSPELLKARHPDGLPQGTMIAVEKDRKTGRVLRAYLVPKQPDMTGDYLTDARVYFDNVQGEWVVSFTWSAQGARMFAKLTEKNIGKPMAIILDHDVYSAPQIRARISRQGEITGNFSSKEASDLAVVLRAGALPIPIRIEEERTIGPELGEDSIAQGLTASAVGFLVVVLFTVAYYRLSGVYASIALFVNMLMIVGLMSLFRGTLTLPGIAGLVLTVGMAVDANVIIFERIREELRAGRMPRAAISTGFDKATWTILDANITTLITAIILFQYGTGPIKGFAVTLSVGIVTSVFAALVITRLFFAIRPGNRNVATLSI